MSGARKRERATVASDAYIEPRQQAQWDAFFRKLAPKCLAFQRIVAKAHGLTTSDLRFESAFPTEMPSTRVADALHKPTKFTDLRADGMYLPVSGEPIVAYEFQSTFNAVMQLRFAMYGEAFEENQRENGYAKRPRFVQIYSGAERINWATENHRKFVEGYARYLLIYLDAMDPADFVGDSLEGHVIQLSRRQEDDIEQFVQLRNRILSLSPSDRRSMLLKSLVIASFNKPAIAIQIIGEWTLDPDLAKGLSVFLPALQAKLVADERNRAQRRFADAIRYEEEALRTAIRSIVEATSGPPDYLEDLDDYDKNGLSQILDQVQEGAKHGWAAAPGTQIAPRRG